MSIWIVLGATILAGVGSFAVAYGIYWFVSLRKYEPTIDIGKTMAECQPTPTGTPHGNMAAPRKTLTHVGNG